MSQVIDKAKYWRSDPRFEARQLADRQAHVPGGLLLTWLIERSLVHRTTANRCRTAMEAFRLGEDGAAEVYQELEGVLTTDDLEPSGAAFAMDFYTEAAEGGIWDVLSVLGPDVLTIPDDRAALVRISVLLDSAYAAWLPSFDPLHHRALTEPGARVVPVLTELRCGPDALIAALRLGGRLLAHALAAAERGGSIHHGVVGPDTRFFGPFDNSAGAEQWAQQALAGGAALVAATRGSAAMIEAWISARDIGASTVRVWLRSPPPRHPPTAFYGPGMMSTTLSDNDQRECFRLLLEGIRADPDLGARYADVRFEAR